MKSRRKVMLIIRDGWGINKNPNHNAVYHAHTPNTDRWLAEYPHTIIDTSGESVGLPDGYMGSSEAGHLNIGAGRVVEQELKKINDAIENGTFFQAEAFKQVIQNVKNNDSTLHLMGLVQNEGVHAHQEHLFAILAYAAAHGLRKVVVHFFSDGRDTPPRSSLGFLETLEKKIAAVGVGTVGTLMGRYYAMDRGRNWKLTTRAYDALTRAVGRRVATAREAIEYSYDHDQLSDGGEMFDEYIPPTIIGDFAGIADGDSVIHFNYRQDRAIQLTYAFVRDDYPGERWKKLNVPYAGLTRYYDEFHSNILPAMDAGVGMANLLGEVLGANGLPELRVSETQKFRHVTSFFNGKRIEPFALEDRLEIPSRFDPSSFGEHPEMEAYSVTDALLEAIASDRYPVIITNYANCDMVGHTGIFEAAKRAVEIVDECLGKVVEAALAKDYAIIITSDHGNAEQMLDYDTGQPKTSHTTFPVDLFLLAKETSHIQLRPRGRLSDIAPTMLYLLGLEQPVEMTGRNLMIRAGRPLIE